MKNKTGFIVSYVCVLLFASLGIGILGFADREERISNTENRMLQGFPTLSPETVLDGSFMEDFDSYLSDAFPERDGVINASKAIMRVFGEEDEEKALKEALERETGGDDEYAEEASAAVLTDVQDSAEAAEELSTDAEDTDEESVQSAESDTSEEIEVGDATFRLYHEDGSCYIVENYKADYISYVAGVFNQYRACLPEDGTVHVINAPVSKEANPMIMKHYFSDWEYTLDDVMQPLLDEGVYFYDTFEIFEPYFETDDLFSTEDHHWHAIGALRAANAMLSNIGYNTEDFYEYDYWLGLNLKEGPFNPDRLKAMTVKRENLKVLNPLAPVDAYLITHLNRRAPSKFLDFKYAAYSMYIGGPHGPYRLFETGFHTGRHCLVIGDSDSYAFIPYLTPYYDTILSTDPRNANYKTNEVGASIRKYIEEYSIDDIFIVTCTGTQFNGPVFSYRLEKFLNTDYGLG